MNRSESKYYNTALMMDRALIKLLEEKSLEYISVKEICERAGVNRSTFYLHYETISDLLEETAEYIHSLFLASFDRTPEQFILQIEQAPLSELVLVGDRYLRPYLQFVYDNRSVFKATMNNPVCMKAEKQLSDIKQYIIEPVLERFRIPKDIRNYWLAYYLSGIWAVIREWINRDCREDIRQIITVIESCVRPGLILTDEEHGEQSI